MNSLSGWIVFSILTFVCIGCGSKTYEDRLEFTTTYFDFIDRLNQNLSPQFMKDGVTIRIPKQLTEIPAPPPRPKSSEEDEPPQVDPRQPTFVEMELPGMTAAWKANLTTVDASGATSSETGYLYLLTNYDYWRTFKTKDEIGDPLKFHEDVLNDMVDALQVVIDEKKSGTATDRVNKWFHETVPEPKDEKFAPPKEFTTITLVPEEPAEDGLARQYQVYLYQNGDMRMALVYALPRNVSAGEELENRILLSLQTVDLSTEKPAVKRAPAQPAPNGNGAPAASPETPAATTPSASPF
ncbi:MAG TPA: hypothetical protein DD473_09880 [Planctomycetaceae bacterium]|nr:hypothetical protein [Planctomycetaceae bacterium]|tara:strand:- start:31 stop:921 length:891 start_codon:yes stop_codon:yes gene_type:complete